MTEAQLKEILDRVLTWPPERQEDVAWLAGLQGELHDQFVAWVRQRRGDKLTGTTDELFSGEVWTGAKAVELGLVDGLGTLRGVLDKRYPNAHVVSVEPRRSVLARIGVGGAAARLGLGGAPGDQLLALFDLLEQRATWSRFGL